MKLTDYDMTVLRRVAEYYLLSASQIHRICFPNNKDRRTTRRRLARLVQHGYLARSAVNVAFSTGNAGPAYYSTLKGCETLAAYLDDDVWLATNLKPPRADRMFHWLDISETHFIVEQAVECAKGVELVGWINEWETINKDDGKDDQFVLHTLLREQPPLSCSPDAAFLLDVGGHRLVHYVEVDRGTSGARRVAASKTPGYAELAAVQAHRRHFPETTFNDFLVLIITVSANHRDRLMREVAKKAENRPDLWMFIDQNEFTPESAIYGDIVWDHQGNVASLVARPDEGGDAQNRPMEPSEPSSQSSVPSGLKDAS